MELYIFDFDDTLAITDSRVLVRRNGQDIWMTSREFAEFEFNPSTDELDFGDFGRAQGTLIKDTIDELERAMNDGADVFIVTARSIAQPVEDWLMSELGYAPQVVATAGSSGKKPWLLNHLQTQSVLLHPYSLHLNPYPPLIHQGNNVYHEIIHVSWHHMPMNNLN